MRYLLKPLAKSLVIPDMIWLWNRITELEESSSIDCTPYSVMAILTAAEPRYLQVLRPIVRPTIEVDDSPMVLLHIEDVFAQGLVAAEEGKLF
jgi:hypothetical protein